MYRSFAVFSEKHRFGVIVRTVLLFSALITTKRLPWKLFSISYLLFVFLSPLRRPVRTLKNFRPWFLSRRTWSPLFRQRRSLSWRAFCRWPLFWPEVKNRAKWLFFQHFWLSFSAAWRSRFKSRNSSSGNPHCFIGFLQAFWFMAGLRVKAILKRCSQGLRCLRIFGTI